MSWGRARKRLCIHMGKDTLTHSGLCHTQQPAPCSTHLHSATPGHHSRLGLIPSYTQYGRSGNLTHMGTQHTTYSK